MNALVWRCVWPSLVVSAAASHRDAAELVVHVRLRGNGPHIDAHEGGNLGRARELAASAVERVWKISLVHVLDSINSYKLSHTLCASARIRVSTVRCMGRCGTGSPEPCRFCPRAPCR